MRTLQRWLNGINGILLVTYIYIIGAGWIFFRWNAPLSGWSFVGASLAAIAVLCVLCALAMHLAGKVSLTPSEPTPRLRTFALGALLFCGALAICLWKCFRIGGGIFSRDAIWQYDQAMSGKYNDWHPVLHTLLAFWLPLRLTGSKGAIVLFQFVEFSLVIGYFGCVFYKYSRNYRLSRWFVLLFVLYFFYKRAFYIVLYPWKDVAFAMVAMVLMLYALQIHLTGGEWLRRRRNAILFAVMLVLATFVRHNGILFTLPVLIGALLYLPKQAKLRLLAFVLLLFFLIKVPLYAALNVEKPGERHTELLGLPMTVIGNVVKEHPESLDEESLTFAHEFASQEEWEELYQEGDFNSIKWAKNNAAPIEAAGYGKVLRVTAKCFAAEPLCALRGLLHLISFVIFPDRRLGRINLFILFLMAAKLNLRRKADRRLFLMSISMLTYNFGTMLLLSGDDYRFFFSCILTWPVIALMLLSNPGKTKEVDIA